jgi:hypothetical protein
VEGVTDGVAVGVTPTFPSTVKAGQTLVPASLQIAWANSLGNGNEGHADNVTGIQLTPACGTFTSGIDCPSAPTDFREPGVFTLSSSGTGVGCGAVTNFTITVVDAASGKVSITPGFQLPVNGVCTISFTLNERGGDQGCPIRLQRRPGRRACRRDCDRCGEQQPRRRFQIGREIPSQRSVQHRRRRTLGTNGAPPVNLSTRRLTGPRAQRQQQSSYGHRDLRAVRAERFDLRGNSVWNAGGQSDELHHQSNQLPDQLRPAAHSAPMQQVCGTDGGL